jgi:hypothetical protein
MSPPTDLIAQWIKPYLDHAPKLELRVVQECYRSGETANWHLEYRTVVEGLGVIDDWRPVPILKRIVPDYRPSKKPWWKGIFT